MSEITDYGKELLRQYVQENWKYIAVLNESDAEIMRLDLLGTDTRTTVTADYETNPVTVQVVVNGDDAEVTVSETTVSKVQLFKVDADGTACVESTVTDFFFTSEDDELTINQTVEIPDIV